jgi:hypothetical protein
MSDEPTRITKNSTLSDHLDRIKQKREVDYGGDVVIRCSNCDRHLLSLVITRADAPVLNKIVVECCHCGDKSFEEEVKGMFAFRPGEGTMLKNIDIGKTETLSNGDTFMQVLATTGKN